MNKYLYLTCLLLLSGIAAPASSDQKPALQIMDVFELEHASAPQISPDGRQVVYVRNFADVSKDQRYSNLWIINVDGTGHRALTSGLANAHTPRWSPDGERLAFISNAHVKDDKGAKPQIYVRHMASGDTSMISRLSENPAGISWSPDGESIAFTMLKRGNAPVVGDMPTAPEGANWKDPARIIDRMVYRFNGAGYLPYGFHHVYTLPSEGGTERQISNGDFQHAGPGSRAGALNWTPDGSQIVMSANRRADADWKPHNTDVFAFDVATGAVTQLTTRDGADGSANVSPDGRMVAYLGFDDEGLGFHTTELYVQNMDGSERRSLMPSLDRSVHALAWAKDSAGLYFAYDDRGVTKLAFTDLGGNYRDLYSGVSGGGAYSAYGGSAQFSVASNGTLAFVSASADRAEDIAVGKDGSFSIVTNVNGDLFAERTLGRVEEIIYPSSVDGREMQGWVIYPPGFDASKKYPLLIEIHGGPFANYGPRFDFEKQYFAAQGYVVLYANPRGSTSYGKDFANLIHHNYPSDDFYDLNSGVDAVIAKGGIDENRLYVMGGSGGGVLSAWMIGRTDRFKAAVIHYPVIEWESFNLTTDIPYVNTYWFPGVPWENREHYFKRSLLSVVDKVKTPSLLITGEADWRTPISQTEQYYTALKIQGVEAVMIRVPDEPHGIRVFPSHWIAKLVHSVGWMHKHP